jgi:hypothetical protein
MAATDPTNGLACRERAIGFPGFEEPRPTARFAGAVGRSSTWLCSLPDMTGSTFLIVWCRELLPSVSAPDVHRQVPG